MDAAAAAAKSLQSCPTLCDPIDGSPPGSPIPGLLQARTLEWVAISFSNAWKWKVKVKSLSRVQLLATPWTAAYQAPPSMGFSRQEYRSRVPLPSPSKMDTRGQILLWFHLCRIPRIGKFTEIENRINFAWLKEGKMGIYCLMRIEFPSGMMKKFWKWTMAIIVQHWWIYLMTLNSIPQKD